MEPVCKDASVVDLDAFLGGPRPDFVRSCCPSDEATVSAFPRLVRRITPPAPAAPRIVNANCQNTLASEASNSSWNVKK